MPIYNEIKLECMYVTNKLKMHTTGVPTLKKDGQNMFKCLTVLFVKRRPQLYPFKK